MGVVKWSELFPGKWSAIIFVTYMALFINQGILVTWSQRNGLYDYNTVIVVLMAEVLKLVVSVALYCRENTFVSLLQDIQKYRKVLLLYMIPAFLYCIYNNLAFLNLAVFDPTTYYLLLQFRVVITGIVFQVVFKKQLSTMQWISLVLLTIGCMIKHVNFDKDVLNTSFNFNINIFFILVQTFFSCFAGVYNEYLLKGQGAKINIFVQNAFMYIDSIFCNVAILLVQGDLLETIRNTGSNVLLDPKVLLIVINNAAVGITTSFFLKNLNSILKTFASAIELVFTAILCWLLFGIPIYANTVIAIAIVSYAVILYSKSPVQNTVVQQKSYDSLTPSSSDEKKPMIEEV